MPKSARYKRWVAAFDNHGDQQDDAACEALWSFMEHWKPHSRIHGGDAFDFACFRKKADEGERRERIEGDVDKGCEFIRKFNPTHFLRGNHDQRLWDVAMSDDEKMADFAANLVMDIKEVLGDIPMLPYCKRKGILPFGDHRVMHGYSAGMNAARQTAIVYGNSLFGHVHTHDQAAVPGLERRVAHACGCLCKLDLGYNRGSPSTLRQAHGWAYGLHFLTTNTLQVWHAEKVGDGWYLPSEIVSC